MFKKEEEKQKVEETEKPTGSDKTSEKNEAKESVAAEKPAEKQVEKPADGSAIEQSEQSEQSNNPPKTEPDWKNLYAVTLADFDNYKKRAARDREDVYRYAESDILKDILPSVDNLRLALDNAKEKEDPFVKGVELVAETLLKALKEHGAEPFDSVGETLDTEKMEAITMMPSEEIEEGKVVAEVKKGWMLREKVLRAAQVVVSSGKPQQA